MDKDTKCLLQKQSAKHISDLFKSHHIKCTIENNKILFYKEQISIETYCFNKNSNPNLTVLQLDVCINYGINAIVESFAGIGKDFIAANIDAIENFTNNSFHTILSAFFTSKFDNQLQKYNWDISSKKFEVFSSNIGIRGAKPKNLNTKWFKQFETEILKLQLDEGVHSIRLFYSQTQNQTTVCEVLINNKHFVKIQEKAEKFDWQKQEDFYSLRVFMILKNGIDFGRIVKIIVSEQEYEDIFLRLKNIGLSELEIEKAYSFIPEAFGRKLIQDMGVLGSYSNNAVIVTNNKEQFEINLIHEKMYSKAILLVNELTKEGWNDNLKRIAYKSAAFNTLNNALNEGIKLEVVKCDSFSTTFHIPSYPKKNLNKQKKSFWKFW